MASIRKTFYVLLLSSVIWILYIIEPSTRINKSVILTTTNDHSDDIVPKYLVNSSKCKIKNLHPFNPDALEVYEAFEYISCRTKELLTYTTKNNDIAVLHINKSAIPFYSKYGVTCCYSYVTRENNFKDERTRKEIFPDKFIKISDCKHFEDEAILSEDVVFVICRNRIFLYEVYKNVHTVITVGEKVKQKILDFKNTDHKPLSVLIVGIDSISRLNLIRTMPQTYAFLENNGWIGLKGYNKIADNTFPNVMAILTGMNGDNSLSVCNPSVLGKLDRCKMLWYDYQKLGYVTAYAEDEWDLTTFLSGSKRGFTKQPTDYYFIPYILAAERKLKIRLLHRLSYCVGPETSGERILNIAKDFTETFKNHPYFGLFWMNTFSHSNINSASRMDGKVLQFLKDLATSEVLENTVTIFLSDHGTRFGDFILTRTGWMEERLPFAYISMPYWFKNQHPDILRNLNLNTGRLTTPYDMYMTLQDILAMSGTNYSTKKSMACPLCRSLFEEVDPERSCEEAAIEPHWCTCENDVEIDKKSDAVQEASKYALDAIQDILKRYKNQTEKCATFKIEKIVSSYISKTTFSTNTKQLRLIFETNPQAVFGATVAVSETVSPGFALLGPISRLDSYAGHSWCVNDSTLKLYCYCLNTLMYIKEKAKL